MDALHLDSSDKERTWSSLVKERFLVTGQEQVARLSKPLHLQARVIDKSGRVQQSNVIS